MNTPRFVVLTGVAAAAGAFSVAAMISAGSASAAPIDEYLIPNLSSFDATSALGYPPLIDVLQGNESWTIAGLPDNVTFNVFGVDTQTTFGSFTNNDFLTNLNGEFGTVGIPFLPDNTEIDLMDFGGGFANEWINIPVGAIPGLTFADPGVSDLLITPFGNFELFGTYFSDLVTAQI
ncbi:hypothetical protein PT015_04775 [Candidatus Mycobacterium wuenschmannii]|uniref:PPE family protein n=1 Tax=Candidatus Mycobacterium wuenschmannii TaxID=3027808 RepID=A0ABY8W107_9MYCO|nr:hypothetical protein [Candidatus Mycobacterium wuenschmannii]WIM88806.1 hypothetical protein PT015_04775 [Candidatus Mycobacterium wuenschmannii]